MGAIQQAYAQWSWPVGASANPQLKFFENFPLGNIVASRGISNGTLSVHAVNIPASISFNSVMLWYSFTATPNKTHTVQFGLYSDNAGTLSIANSASGTITASNTPAQSWASLATSAAQNISPGQWYFAMNVITAGNINIFYGAANSVGVAGSAPGFVMGRMTVSTNALPASIATSDLDTSGGDATRQFYMLICA